MRSESNDPGWIIRCNLAVTEALASGLLLGLSCGLSPGPLMALVLLLTLRHGPCEGCKVAFVPLLSDLPVILVALLFAAQAAKAQSVLGLISIAGAVFLLYLAIESFRPKPATPAGNAALPKSLLKGTLINLLSPNPWLFWLTVGAGTLAEAMKHGWQAAAAFLGLFYLMLIGAKLMIAILAGRSRHFLEGRAYRVVMGLLGFMLGVFAVLLFRQGLQYLLR
jgi:threonine/homoserine/homoserine lactone efflux protein